MLRPTLEGLIKWMQRPEYASGFKEVFTEHLGTVCEEAGVEFEELDDALHSSQVKALFNCVLEDFIGRTHDSDNRNVVDDYLKRRGWKEPVLTKRYLRALRDSEMSLYEVSEVVPGQSFLAHDLVRGGPPVRVTDPDVANVLKTSDRIATRIVELNGKRIISAGTLPFDLGLSESLLEKFATAKSEMRDVLKDLPRESDPAPDAPTESELLDIFVMGLASPLISAVWLQSRLAHLSEGDALPTKTSEGDDVAYHDVCLPLLPGVSPDTVRERLDGIEALRRDESDLPLWTWDVARPRAQTPPSQDGAQETEEPTTRFVDKEIFATVYLEEEGVRLKTTSAAREASARALVAPALDGVVGAAITKIITLEQAKLANPPKPRPSRNEIPPNTPAALMNTVLDDYYRALLDQPIPMLGGVAPREAARTASGRTTLVEWLKNLEGTRAPHNTGNPFADYDFGWMWVELGVEALRT